MSDEREDWEALILSPGWQRFTAYVEAEVRQQIEQELSKALDQESDAVAAGRMRQVLASKRMVERVLGYPKFRLRQLMNGDGVQTTTQGRGGLG